MEMPPVTTSPANSETWQKLRQLAKSAPALSIQQMLNDSPNRVARFSVESGELLLDFSKNLLDEAIWSQLLVLAEESGLASHRKAMFAGEKINSTEDRAVQHTALRAKRGDQAGQDALARAQLIEDQLAAVAVTSEKIRAGEWLGSTGKPVTDVINIGIGGSDLGPKLACAALEEYSMPALRTHFISNVDGAEILSLLRKLDPETTLVIVASKTFTTQETLLNAKTAREWFETKLGLKNPQSSNHFIGVTANPENALKYGIPESQILKFAEWVGGRYSLWSAIGLPIAIAVGFNNFKAMLEGAREMDLHFQEAPFDQNMPVILGLLGIWYSNFLGAQSAAVIPYCERLLLLPSYLQQLDMESNGKSITSDGKRIDYKTGPILWGQTGTNGQHAFFQLLHQGTHLVPIDFVAAVNDRLSNQEHHRVLLGNMLAQSSALMTGQDAPAGQPYRYYPGNRPSNVLLMRSLSPKNFGALIALYEHKVFVQGSIWNINSFDQWGVELGKKMANQLLAGDSRTTEFDGSTRNLFDYIQKNTD